MNYEELKELVKKHCHLYYNVNRPEISDQEFDALYEELESREKFQGWSSYDSPTRKVGGARGKVKHPYKLYSLKKVYDKDQVDPAFTVCTPKIDGANLTLIYIKGELALAITRGDGEQGEDVTHLALNISNIPKKLTTSYKEVVINGECVTDNEVSNFRNYVSGALGLDSVEDFKTRNILFIAHDWLGVDLNYTVRMNVVKTMGFDTVINDDFCVKFPQDGVVYRLDSYSKSQELGYTFKYPRFAVALKPKGILTAITELQEVLWVIGRTGQITPVGVIVPVVLDGATISRVTLHNLGVIEDHNLAVGDTIEIERAGGVIPKFVKVVEKSLINSSITARHAEEALGVPTYRSGPKLFCKEVADFNKAKNLEHFIKAMDIKGIGPSTIKTLNLKHPLDLYQYHNWESLGVRGLSIKQEIEKSSSKPYSTVLYALGIPGVGEATAKDIATIIPKFSNLREIETTKIPKIGAKTIEKILSWLDVNEEWVYELPVCLVQDLHAQSKIEDKNKKLCITGVLDISRSAMEKHLKSLGYTISSSVTKDLFALITDGKQESKKFIRANELGIKIINFWEHKDEIMEGKL